MMSGVARLLSLRVILPTLILVQMIQTGAGYKLRSDDERQDDDNNQIFHPDPACRPRNGYRNSHGDFWMDGERHACKKATIHPHGWYTARIDSCEIRFHSIPVAETKGTEGTFSSKLTTACSDQNLAAEKANSYLEYRLQHWPDVCVADFKRCYSVLLHEDVYKQVACQLDWQIPKNTTHISVDCTADALARDKAHNEAAVTSSHAYDPYNDPYQRHERAKRRELYLVVTVCITMILFTCCFVFCLTHRLVVRPFFETWRLDSLERARLMRKDKDEDFDDEALVSKGTELRQRSAAST